MECIPQDWALRRLDWYCCQSGNVRNSWTWEKTKFRSLWYLLKHSFLWCKSKRQMAIYVRHFTRLLIGLRVNPINVQGMYGHYVTRKLAFKCVVLCIYICKRGYFYFIKDELHAGSTSLHYCYFFLSWRHYKCKVLTFGWMWVYVCVCVYACV